MLLPFRVLRGVRATHGVRAAYGVRAACSVRGAYNGASRSWTLLPSGSRWRELRAGAEEDAPPAVLEGSVVRVDYTARLDDGTQVAKATASFRVGTGASGVCAALDEVTDGMQLGDCRRLRAPPQSRRGPLLERAAPADAMIEYDVTLTGVLSNRRIYTVEGPAGSGGDALQRLVGSASASLARFASLLGLTSGRDTSDKK